MSRSSSSTAEQGNSVQPAEGPPGPASDVSNDREEGRRMDGKSRPELKFDPIEAALRQLHESFAQEDIPDDFLDLLDQLDDDGAAA